MAEAKRPALIADVQEIVENALRARFPTRALQSRPCSQCNNLFDPKGFTGAMWQASDEERVCMVCKPVNSRLLLRAKDGKACAECKVHTQRSDFSLTQWGYGVKAKCKVCVNSSAFAADITLRKDTRFCSGCQRDVDVCGFSKTQLSRAVSKVALKCRTCAGTGGSVPKKEPISEEKPTTSGEPKQCLVKDKADATRWVMEAEETDLPSVNSRSWHAMRALRNRKGDQWWDTLPAQDKSGISLTLKMSLLKTAHEELSHAKGRDGIVKALKEEGKTWNNMEDDAAWIILRCERCRKSSTAGTCEADIRHLPVPMHAGEVIGWDLKKVSCPSEAAWIMLLAVDFTSKKVFAWDLDVDKATAGHVYEIIIRFQHEQETNNHSQYAGAQSWHPPHTIPPPVSIQ